MDDHIGERITDLSRSVQVGFERQERANDRIEAKFDKVVTQSEFSATVRRLELQDSNIEEKVDRGLADIRSEMVSGLAQVREDVAEGFGRISEEGRARITKTRWLIATGVAALGAVNAIVFNVIGAIFRQSW